MRSHRVRCYGLARVAADTGLGLMIKPGEGRPDTKLGKHVAASKDGGEGEGWEEGEAQGL